MKKEICVKHNDDEKAYDRRGFLQCMAWVGTGAMWTLTSGVLKGMPIEQAARGAIGHGAGMGGLRFVQISDHQVMQKVEGHVSFHVHRVPATGARLISFTRTIEGGRRSVEDGSRFVADVVSRRQSPDCDHRRAA